MKEEMEKHLACRRKGLESDFTLKEAKEFLLGLTYCTIPDSSSEDDDIGWVPPKQWNRINRMLAKKKSDEQALVSYLKRKSREFPREYYLKTLLTEHLADMKRYTESLRYAEDAYEQEPTDMLVAYDYANALCYNGKYDDAIKIISIVIQTDINIIAYGDHGEGLRWAKTLQRDAKEVLEVCMKEKNKRGL